MRIIIGIEGGHVMVVAMVGVEAEAGEAVEAVARLEVVEAAGERTYK